MNSIRYFFAQTKYNLKNAHALKQSFWIGVVSMILNNFTFFIIWWLFMKATGPINGWTSLDIFGMLGASIIVFGVTHSFLCGLRDLPQFVMKGSFDSILLSPANTFLKLGGSSFSITAYGDLIQGLSVVLLYGILSGFSLIEWFMFLFAIIIGCVIFACIRLLCSLVVFFIHDGEVVSEQLFEIFLRPGLYPGAIFPNKLKLFFMTVVPALLTSAVPVDVFKLHSWPLLVAALLITLMWCAITYGLFMWAIKRYESGNFLR